MATSTMSRIVVRWGQRAWNHLPHRDYRNYDGIHKKERLVSYCVAAATNSISLRSLLSLVVATDEAASTRRRQRWNNNADRNNIDRKLSQQQQPYQQSHRLLSQLIPASPLSTFFFFSPILTMKQQHLLGKYRPQQQQQNQQQQQQRLYSSSPCPCTLSQSNDYYHSGSSSSPAAASLLLSYRWNPYSSSLFPNPSNFVISQRRRQQEQQQQQRRSFASKKHKRMIRQYAKGYRGRAKNCFTIAMRRIEKAWQYAYRDRRVKHRRYRTLWIQRIHAALSQYATINYSRFIPALSSSHIQLNRKVLSELACHEPFSFKAIHDVATMMMNHPHNEEDDDDNDNDKQYASM